VPRSRMSQFLYMVVSRTDYWNNMNKRRQLKHGLCDEARGFESFLEAPVPAVVRLSRNIVYVECSRGLDDSSFLSKRDVPQYKQNDYRQLMEFDVCRTSIKWHKKIFPGCFGRKDSTPQLLPMLI